MGDLQGATPPFSDGAGRPPSPMDDDDEAIESNTDPEESSDLLQTRGIKVHFPTSFVDEADNDDEARKSSTDLEKSRDLLQTRGISVHVPPSFVDVADDYDEAANSSTHPVHVPTLVDEFN